MLAEAREGSIDVIVCEALDRITRDGEDISWLGKKLRYDHVRLFTSVEGEIDEIKLAVAGLLGPMFLSNLRHKTFRGMKAAMLAGRLAGGKAYGYHKVRGPNGPAGIMEIMPTEAETVRWILTGFAEGRSSVSLATELNQRGTPGSRGGKWNASTIRATPRSRSGSSITRSTGSSSCGGGVSGARIRTRKGASGDTVCATSPNGSRWQYPTSRSSVAISRPRWIASSPGAARRPRRSAASASVSATCYPASSTAASGSNYTISGKDYYRCAGAKEHGTCSSKLSVRVTPLEQGVLAALQKQLLTADMAELFGAEFQREVARLAKASGDVDREAERRLVATDAELSTLSENLIAGVVGPTIMTMIAAREAEREGLIAARRRERNSSRPTSSPTRRCCAGSRRRSHACARRSTTRRRAARPWPRSGASSTASPLTPIRPTGPRAPTSARQQASCYDMPRTQKIPAALASGVVL